MFHCGPLGVLTCDEFNLSHPPRHDAVTQLAAPSGDAIAAWPRSIRLIRAAASTRCFPHFLLDEFEMGLLRDCARAVGSCHGHIRGPLLRSRGDHGNRGW